MEIREIFIEQIMDFFKENIKKNGDTVKAFCNALQKGEAEEAEQRFSDYLLVKRAWYERQRQFVPNLSGQWLYRLPL